MATLGKLKKDFLGSVSDCRALYRHCRTPLGPHSDAGVEAAFLQLMKSWETFLEDCTVAFLSQRLRIDGKSVPALSISISEEYARRSLLQDRPFLEWTDVDRNIRRWDQLFVGSQQNPNLFESAVRPAKAQLRQMVVIRNAIAHSSQSAHKQFGTLLMAEFGGSPRMKRPAELLVSNYVGDTTITYFDLFSGLMETLAPMITG
jgi:hypothetical protein